MAKSTAIIGTPSPFVSAKAQLCCAAKLVFVSREKRAFVARRKLILLVDFRRRKVAFSRWGHVRGEDGAFRLQLFPRSSAQFAQQKFQPRLCLEFLIGAFASIQFEKLLISGGRFGFPS